MSNKPEGFKEKSMKKNIKRSQYHLNKRIFNITIILFLVLNFLALYFLYPLIILPWDIFERNLGRLNLLEILLNVNFVVVMTIIVYYLISGIYTIFKKKPNWWFWGTILLMLFLFYSGTMIIDSEVGVKDIKLKLRNMNGTIYADEGIKCSRNFLVGDSVSCAVLPLLKNITANITFTFENGTSETINKLTFIAPSNLKNICFEVEGIEINNNKRHLSICNPHHFFTEKDYIEIRKTFLSYVIGLFGIIFVTVPYTVLNFKKLLGRDKE